MILPDITDVTEQHIRDLVDNQILESSTLDYKANYYDDCVEFLKDVTAFANADGGQIVIGIREDRGVPSETVGLDAAKIDSQRRKMEQWSLANLEPPLSIKTQAYLVDGAPVVIVQVPASLNAPHISRQEGRFWTRGSSGKDRMSVDQIREAFLGRAAFMGNMRKLHARRLEEILKGERGFFGRFTLLHMVPFSAHRNPLSIEPARIQNETSFFTPICGDATSRRINLDGFYLEELSGDELFGWVQVFRNGSVESMFVEFEPENTFSGLHYEDRVILGVTRHRDGLKSLGVEGPISIQVTLHGVKDVSLRMWPNDMPRAKRVIDRPTLVFPDVVVQSINDPIDRALRPVFDSLAHASGYNGCPHYDTQGNWVSDPRKSFLHTST